MSFFKPSSTFFSLNQYSNKKKDQLISLIQQLSEIIPFNNERSNNYIADEMILFSRSLDFLKEKNFVDIANNVLDEDDIHFKDFSAIIWRKHILTWAGDHCKKIDGDFCDFGCYDGSGSKLINDYCKLNEYGKSFYLYDIFDEPPDSHKFPKHSKKFLKFRIF